MQDLYKKIHAVMCDSEGLSKDMMVAGQYKAVSESAVLNTVKPLLKKHGLVIYPVGVEQEREGKLTSLRIKWKLVDVESGQSDVLESIGHGADTQDKGSGKAFTYAYKALVQKTFMLFSGEDTDNYHSDEITKSIEKEQTKVAKLKDLFKRLPSEEKGKILSGYKVDAIEQIPEAKWDAAIKYMGGVIG